MTVVPFDRRERESQARMTGGRGDLFRTVEAEDMFRARAASAHARLYRLASHVPAPAPETSSAGATFGPWADHNPRCKCNVCR